MQGNDMNRFSIHARGSACASRSAGLAAGLAAAGLVLGGCSSSPGSPGVSAGPPAAGSSPTASSTHNPAGGMTSSAFFPVDTTMALKADGFPVSVQVRTWVANGVGPVKSEALVDEGGTSHITAVEKLKSFTQG
jgi:hypothetical protein